MIRSSAPRAVALTDLAVLALGVLPVDPGRPAWGAAAVGPEPACTRTARHEGSVAECPVEPGPADVFKYVGLGDSYPAGEGIEPYFEPHNGCHRSERAYPTLVEAPGSPTRSIHDRQQLGDRSVQWGFQACSGAEQADP